MCECKPTSPWDWSEKKRPGCRRAWERDVKLPVEGFSLGTTGKPTYVVATDKRHYSERGLVFGFDCECRWYLDGPWTKCNGARTQPSQDCDVPPPPQSGKGSRRRDR